MKQNLATRGAVRGLEHQRVDQDVGRDVDQRRGPDDGGPRGMGGAQEDVVHALDGPGAVLGLAQVQGHDLGPREGDLQGLFMDRQPQARAAAWPGQGQDWSQ